LAAADHVVQKQFLPFMACCAFWEQQLHIIVLVLVLVLQQTVAQQLNVLLCNGLLQRMRVHFCNMFAHLPIWQLLCSLLST
jgi:hypothetical protein